MYVLQSATPPWGDYGAVLWHGLVERPSTPTSSLVIRRAGSFVPPIFFPWPTIVVTDSLRNRLAEAELTGVEWRPVHVDRAVQLDWNTWSSSTPEPPIYPSGGEPENYILKRKHSKEVASQIPPLHELFIENTPGLQREGGALVFENYAGQDVARASRFGYIFVSAKLADLLTKEVPTWVSITRAKVDS